MKTMKAFLIVAIGPIIMSLVLLPLSLDICSGQKFPTRPVTIIVNFGAGGATDTATRPLAKAAEKHLGVPIIIVNKTGGGGTVGVTELSRAKPDGYTIGTTPIFTMTVIPMLREVGYDSIKNFEYVCGYGRYLYGIFTRKDSPFKSIKDLVQAARKNPGKITYGAGSIGIAMGLKYLEAEENIKLTYIPFKSGSRSVTALVGGHVDLSTGSVPDHFQFVESKEIKALAVVTADRWPEIPDVPTMKDLGYDIDITGWMTLGAPAGVPKDRLDILYRAFKKASDDPGVKALYKKLKISAPCIDGEQVKKTYARRKKEWKPLIEALKADQAKKK
jgi:tripartite-type tricarboxylate transporter receptor subunit TctC